MLIIDERTYYFYYLLEYFRLELFGKKTPYIGISYSVYNTALVQVHFYITNYKQCKFILKITVVIIYIMGLPLRYSHMPDLKHLLEILEHFITKHGLEGPAFKVRSHSTDVSTDVSLQLTTNCLKFHNFKIRCHEHFVNPVTICLYSHCASVFRMF